MEKQQIYDLAERYLAGQLDQEEKNKVDHQLESDPEFAKVFAKYLTVNQEVKDRSKAAWKEELMTNFDTSEKIVPAPEKGKIRSLNLRWLSAAAAVLLLVVAAFWILNKAPNTDNLFAETTTQIIQKRVYESTVRSSTNSFNNAFKNKDYQKAMTIASEELLQADDLDQPIWKERLGFCHWKTNNYQKALIIFQELEKNQTLLPAKNPALWYQALTYVAMNDIDNAQQTLKQITNLPNYQFTPQATNLLKQLNTDN